MLLLSLTLTLLLLSIPPGWEREGEGPQETAKASMAARSSPELREHFRAMHTHALANVLNDSALNQVLDSQIDDFVKEIAKKNERLEEAADRLSRTPDPAMQRRSIRLIRDTAADLEGTLRVWTDLLRPLKRPKGADTSSPLSTIESLLQQVALYIKQINQFLFPEDVAVSVHELRSEGFHGTLKKIQRVAQQLSRE
ncbi:MAG: hypothetical protein HY315_08830 [Acidobacteria bacterium]|nr:hypothetical protein [Acidobacteriota bacterium]